ncbi:unnamed protein product [Arabidopsis halleri]
MLNKNKHVRGQIKELIVGMGVIMKKLNQNIHKLWSNLP